MKIKTLLKYNLISLSYNSPPRRLSSLQLVEVPPNTEVFLAKVMAMGKKQILARWFTIQRMYGNLFPNLSSIISKKFLVTPLFSSWILIALAKICLFYAVIYRAKYLCIEKLQYLGPDQCDWRELSSISHPTCSCTIITGKCLYLIVSA